jgi:predicted glycosyltransferase
VVILKILIDIIHPADINFYKNAIKELIDHKHEVVVTYINRGSVKKILDEEYSIFKIEIVNIGEHKHKKIKKIINIPGRIIQLIKYIKIKKIDLATGFGSFYVGFAGKFSGIKTIIFYDDYEYKEMFKLAKISADKFIIPKSINYKSKNTLRVFDYKELSYLHKKYFKPNKDILKKYNLKPFKYIFIREVSGISLNYKNKNNDMDNIITDLIEKKNNIVLSLEDKKQIEKYKNNCIILKEPVKDFYSLIFFSKLTISSGDTVAREAALLGVPSIYTGKRDMGVNKSLIKKGLIQTSMINTSQLKKKKINYDEYVDTTKKIVEIIENEC